MDLTFDLPGKISQTRLPYSQALKPVFEAVSNSIQSLEDAEELNGRIEITLHRPRQLTLGGQVNVNEQVHSISISDNGIGFTEANFTSFSKGYSRLKANRGCKGVGRFIWLKSFESVEIESNYFENGKNWTRKFRFTPTEQGIENELLMESDSQERRTTVKLVGMKKRYHDGCPKQADTIAHRIVDYCLPHFIHQRAPIMLLIDSDGSKQNLNEVFTEMQLHQDVQKFQIKSLKFQITHLLVPASHEQMHRLHLCANGWAVKGESVTDKVPELRSPSSPIRDKDHAGRQLFYIGYLTGDLLDQILSEDRIDFSFGDEEQTIFTSGESECPKSLLMEKAVEKVVGYLAPHLTEIRAQRDAQVKDHVFSRSPQYRPLLKHRPEVIASIPPNLSVEKLEIKLYEANQIYNVELNQEYHRLLAAHDASAVDLETHQKRLETFLEEWNEEGMAKLAWHVAYRHATLAFMEQELEWDNKGKYRLENAIHRVVFPLKATSDDLPWDQQNLWIIDEKLTYHQYLASDKPMKKLKANPVDSKDRPDIIVFNKPIAIADSHPSYGSVVIFEFKRAMRDDYTESDNPMLQVINYVKKLKTGKEVDRHGRPISKDKPYYGYVICDLTPKLGELAELYGLKPTPDGEGFFGYPPAGLYLEVVSFGKLLTDARRRNQRVFDLLGFRTPRIPATSKPLA